MPASASKSALLLSPCLRWAMPGARVFDDRNANTTKRDKGTLFHSLMYFYFIGAFKLSTAAAQYPDVWDWYIKALEWVHAVLEPRCAEIHSEVYFGYNFATGDVHTDANVHDRQYPNMAGYLPGTADLVCILNTGELLVADWKTGSGQGADKQLLSLACGARKVYLAPDGSFRPVRLAVLYAGEAAYDGNGVVSNEWAVTESELAAHEHAMAFQLADIGVRTDAVPGGHCTQMYCPHLAYCPAITKVVSDAGAKLIKPELLVRRTTVEMTDKPTSDEHAGYVGAMIAAAKRQLEYYNNGLRVYAEHGGHIVAGDQELKQTNSGFRWVKRGN